MIEDQLGIRIPETSVKILALMVGLVMFAHWLSAILMLLVHARK